MDITISLGDSEEYHAKRAPEQTWPDLDGRCDDLLKEAFSVLNEAPGRRQKYADVQALIAQAIRVLRA